MSKDKILKLVSKGHYSGSGKAGGKSFLFTLITPYNPEIRKQAQIEDGLKAGVFVFIGKTIYRPESSVRFPITSYQEAKGLVSRFLTGENPEAIAESFGVSIRSFIKKKEEV